MVGASLMRRFREGRFRLPLRYHLIALVVIALVQPPSRPRRPRRLRRVATDDVAAPNTNALS